MKNTGQKIHLLFIFLLTFSLTATVVMAGKTERGDRDREFQRAEFQENQDNRRDERQNENGLPGRINDLEVDLAAANARTSALEEKFRKLENKFNSLPQATSTSSGAAVVTASEKSYLNCNDANQTKEICKGCIGKTAMINNEFDKRETLESQYCGNN